MGSSNSRSEYHSKWQSDEWCDCGTSHSRAIKIEWRSHPMMNGAAEFGVNTARCTVAVTTLGISTVFNGGIAAPLHHAVLVIFVCDKCGAENWATYELAKKGKECRFGYYLFYRESVRSAKINVPFSTVHGIYEAMSNGYSAVNWNCIRFARSFYWEVDRANNELRFQLANLPITQVLTVRGRADLLPCFNRILENGNKKALDSVGMELSDRGLDHISDAFVKGFKVGMVCYKCGNRLINIDELCYCVDAKERCHHRITFSALFLPISEAANKCHDCNCCVRMNREELANLSITQVLSAHRRVDLVPCFNSILKSGNKKALDSVGMELFYLGFDFISDAFVKGFNTGMVCAKCAKKLHIDELCYCTEAADKCHHRNCC